MKKLMRNTHVVYKRNATCYTHNDKITPFVINDVKNHKEYYIYVVNVLTNACISNVVRASLIFNIRI